MDPRPPAGAPRVPGYTVERPLGAGPYASVWAAVSEHSGGRVALKVLRGAASASAIRREASLLAAVDHPHVMRVVELVETDGVLVLVFPLAEGGSLGDLVRVRGALEPGEVVTACAPIAQALDSVHRRGLVHGDVTPSNILLTAEGLPLLADLGVARLAGPRSAEVGLVHGLTAPEVLGGAEPEPAADVYGLAAVAVLALTGRPPGRPVTLPGIAPATAGAIGRCLDPEPGRRPAASTLASALFAMAEPEAIGLVAAGGTPSAATDASGPAPAPPRRAHAGAHRSRHR
ncbi:MAG TPA: serine/threonine-protein kinase, partial [Jiangellales bacterium]|nr:serine/threonine-protein kinase [Jiangellales bacterium]